MSFENSTRSLSSRDKTLLFVDDYPNWVDIIQHFSLNAKPNVSLVLSARSAVHDVMIDSICQIVGKGDIREYTADLLTEDDLGMDK